MLHARSWLCALALLGTGIAGCVSDGGGGDPLPIPTTPECLHTCASVAASAEEPGPLQIRDDRIYWATFADGLGAVQSAPVTGGATQVIASFAADALPAIALDATHVYWTEPRASGALRSALLDGTAVTTLADGLASPTGLVVGDTRVILTLLDQGRLSSVPRDGGAVTLLDGDYADKFDEPLVLAGVVDGQIYGTVTQSHGSFSGEPASTLWVIPIEGGTMQVIGMVPGDVYGVEVTPEDFYVIADSFQVFVADPSKMRHVVWRVPRNGGASSLRLINIESAWSVVVDESGIYFTDKPNGMLRGRSVVKNGDVPPPLVRGIDAPGSVALDEGHVYFCHRTGAGTKWTISRVER